MVVVPPFIVFALTICDISVALLPSLCAPVFAAMVKVSLFAGVPLNVKLMPFMEPAVAGVVLTVIVAPLAGEYGTTVVAEVIGVLVPLIVTTEPTGKPVRPPEAAL